MRAAALLAVLFAAAPAGAGRPVFRELTFEELGARSEAIVLARKAGESERKGEGGCPRRFWRLKVRELLSAGGPRPGAELEVLVNETGYRDCVHRSRNRGAGASFSAERYLSDSPVKPEHGEFVVFLRPEKGAWTLTADGAFETPERKDAARRLRTGGGATQPSPKAPECRDHASCFAKAEAAAAKGGCRDAFRLYGEAIRHEPGDARAWHRRALLRRAGKDAKGAELDMAQVRKLDPGFKAPPAPPIKCAENKR